MILDFFFVIVPSVEDSPSRYQKNCSEAISFETSGEYTINKELIVAVDYMWSFINHPASSSILFNLNCCQPYKVSYK